MRGNMQNIDPENTERPPGFLTDGTRKYLLSGRDTTGPGDVRNQVQKRTRHALADLVLLQRHAPEELKRELVQGGDEPPAFTGVETHQSYLASVFLLEALTGQGSAEIVRTVLRGRGLDQSHDPALNEDMAGTMQRILRQIKRLPISRDEAHAAIEEYW